TTTVASRGAVAWGAAQSPSGNGEIEGAVTRHSLPIALVTNLDRLGGARRRRVRSGSVLLDRRSGLGSGHPGVLDAPRDAGATFAVDAREDGPAGRCECLHEAIASRSPVVGGLARDPHGQVRQDERRT